MIDYYQIITPIFAIFTAVSLLLLKKSLQDTATLTKLRQRKHQSAASSQNPQQKVQKSLRNSIKYMLSNFTLIQLCCIRRAKSKIPFIFSLSVIGILTLFLPQPFIFSWVGSLSYIFLILCSIFSYGKTSIDTHEQQSRLNRQKNVSVIFTILTVLANIVIMGKCFRNYKNDFLAQFISFFAINAVLDNIIVRPIFLILSSIPLHQAQSFQLLIKETTQDLVLLETYDAVGQKEVFEKPGKMYSPSKFNKRIPLQIQPVGYHTEQNNLENQNPLDILKRIKKQKALPPASLTTPLRELNDNRECSMNSFFNSHKQSNDSPLANIDFNNPFSTQKQFDGPSQLSMKKKILSQHMVMINPSNNEQNDQDFQEEITVTNPVNSDITQTQGQQNSKKLLSKTIEDHPLKISMNSSSNPSARQQPLKICIGGQMRVLQGTFQDEQQDQENNDQAFQSIKDSNRNNAFCTLQIKEKEQVNEIQEVDLNSPERRRRGEEVSVVQESRFDVIKKKKKKKMSHDERNNPRIIKFTTGQPYLQYLPDMLTKDKDKKSQSISRKALPMQSRFTNSTKRPKKGKTDNVENMAPTSFRVEDL